ncbi:hypothetical protein [Arthrobacter antibioticus]|uniref:hypothetical protein n=1 Tax=Arthrobacter sp. H35-MC1 TaxID=3046203 RepID=UPI0024B9CB09|nr:hypothetical protein [Arthrobacter sp. H35-MC1]MDJ0318128.1 hypothetical protein [Arthrobacter sp. H35-MC1]
MLVVVALSVVMGWIRNGSQSIFAAIVAQASVNGSLGVLVSALPGSFVEVSNWWGLGIVLGAAAFALITRGRLGLVQQKLGLAL